MTTQPLLRGAAAFAALSVGLLVVAGPASAAWSNDASCSADNAPALPWDYVDWWQGCSAESATANWTSGWPSLQGSVPACTPNRWVDAQGRCVQMTCAQSTPVLASCTPAAGASPRIDAVELTPNGCVAVVATPRGAVGRAVPASRLACSKVLRALGRPLPSDDLRAVPRDFWNR